MITIVNYGMGNLQSVANILDFLKMDYVITDKQSELERADKIILPGVGAFGEAMKNLHELDLIECIRDMALQKKKPILGICLGMQIMATRGYENGEYDGLNLIPGIVKKFDLTRYNLPVPHVGWNGVTPKASSWLYSKSSHERCFYFVHSYHYVCEFESDISGFAEYGEKFVASIERNNIVATQFHPEKSQQDGLEVLKSFLNYRS